MTLTGHAAHSAFPSTEVRPYRIGHDTNSTRHQFPYPRHLAAGRLSCRRRPAGTGIARRCADAAFHHQPGVVGPAQPASAALVPFQGRIQPAARCHACLPGTAPRTRTHPCPPDHGIPSRCPVCASGAPVRAQRDPRAHRRSRIRSGCVLHPPDGGVPGSHAAQRWCCANCRRAALRGAVAGPSRTGLAPGGRHRRRRRLARGAARRSPRC